MTTVRELYRRCERATTDRRIAAFLFWTVGPNQVGKAAISGWPDVIAPALREGSGHVKLWPFDGILATLLGNGRTVVVETYPTEAYRHLNFPSENSSKKEAVWRRDRANAAVSNRVTFSAAASIPASVQRPPGKYSFWTSMTTSACRDVFCVMRQFLRMQNSRTSPPVP